MSEEQNKTAREVLELLWGTAIAQHHGKLTSYGIYDINQVLKDLQALLPNKKAHEEWCFRSKGSTYVCSCNAEGHNKAIDQINELFK